MTQLPCCSAKSERQWLDCVRWPTFGVRRISAIAAAETEILPKVALLLSAETECMPKVLHGTHSAPKLKPKPKFGLPLVTIVIETTIHLDITFQDGDGKAPQPYWIWDRLHADTVNVMCKTESTSGLWLPSWMIDLR